VKDEAKYSDIPPNIFAPGGRLYTVEAAMRAVHDASNPMSSLVVAIKYDKGVAIVTTLPRSPFMAELNATSNGIPDDDRTSLISDTTLIPTPITQVDRSIWVATGGHVSHGLVLRRSVAEAASKIRWAQPTAGVMARIMADFAQNTTQMSNQGANIPRNSLLLVSSDTIFRVDPNGQYWKCKGAVVGRGASLRHELDLSPLIGPDTCRDKALRQAALVINKVIADYNEKTGNGESLDNTILFGMTVEGRVATKIYHKELHSISMSRG